MPGCGAALRTLMRMKLLLAVLFGLSPVLRPSVSCAHEAVQQSPRKTLRPSVSASESRERSADLEITDCDLKLGMCCKLKALAVFWFSKPSPRSGLWGPWSLFTGESPS